MSALIVDSRNVGSKCPQLGRGSIVTRYHSLGRRHRRNLLRVVRCRSTFNTSDDSAQLTLTLRPPLHATKTETKYLQRKSKLGCSLAEHFRVDFSMRFSQAELSACRSRWYSWMIESLCACLSMLMWKHRGADRRHTQQWCLSRQPLWYTALRTACSPLLGDKTAMRPFVGLLWPCTCYCHVGDVALSTSTTSLSSPSTVVDLVPRLPVNVHQVDRQADITAGNTGAVRVTGHVTNRRRLLVPAYIVGQLCHFSTPMLIVHWVSEP